MSKANKPEKSASEAEVVLLQQGWWDLSADILQDMAWRAFHKKVPTTDVGKDKQTPKKSKPADNDFIVAGFPMFSLNYRGVLFMIFTMPHPYFENKEEAAQSATELRLARAIAEHDTHVTIRGRRLRRRPGADARGRRAGPGGGTGARATSPFSDQHAPATGGLAGSARPLAAQLDRPDRCRCGAGACRRDRAGGQAPGQQGHVLRRGVADDAAGKPAAHRRTTRNTATGATTTAGRKLRRAHRTHLRRGPRPPRRTGGL